jgi:nucleoside-diphosphate-sugar epimerase
MIKIFITGGSGFIGQNLIEQFRNDYELLNFDIKEPKNKTQLNYWCKGDILDYNHFKNSILAFNPDYIVHLAARTDLDEEKDIKGYNANIDGVENLINILNQEPLKVRKTIYASSRMVCRIDYVPTNFDDYCPPNLYGESKMIGEKLVKEKAKHPHIIVRPTSIWGPWFEIPYKTFFDTIKSGKFFMPKNINPKKSFGFVLNTTYQLDKLLFTQDKLKQVYYLSDYPNIEVGTWANLIAKYFDVSKPKSLPLSLLKIVAFGGDVLKKLGYKNPPLTTFRLNNLITDMVYDLSALEDVCGKLPYQLEEGVKITTEWIINKKQ